MIFISIGDAEKLQKFLKINANIPRDQVLVDNYNFDAYNAVGFRSFDDMDKETVKDVQMKAPDMGGGMGKWFQYLANVVALSPVEKGTKGIPQGVKRLGGTIVMRGDDVVYKWSDRLPGDTPELDDVMTVVRQYA